MYLKFKKKEQACLKMENKDYIIIYNPELQQQYLDSQIQIYKDMLKLVMVWVGYPKIGFLSTREMG